MAKEDEQKLIDEVIKIDFKVGFIAALERS